MLPPSPTTHLGRRETCAVLPTFTYSQKGFAVRVAASRTPQPLIWILPGRCTDERMFARYGGSLNDLSTMNDERGSQHTSNTSPTRTNSSSLDNAVPCTGICPYSPLSVSNHVSTTSIYSYLWGNIWNFPDESALRLRGGLIRVFSLTSGCHFNPADKFFLALAGWWLVCTEQRDRRKRTKDEAAHVGRNHSHGSGTSSVDSYRCLHGAFESRAGCEACRDEAAQLVDAAIRGRYVTETYMEGRMSVVWRTEAGYPSVLVVHPKLLSSINNLVEICYPGELCLHALSSHSDVFWSAVLLFDAVGMCGNVRLDQLLRRAHADRNVSRALPSRTQSGQ